MRKRVSAVAAFVLLAVYLGIHGASAVSQPVVTGTSPNTATNTGQVTLTVSGHNFVSGATVALQKGTTIITGTGGNVDSEASISGVGFDLTGASPGFWTVRVTNSDTGTGTFGDGSSSGFHVVGAADRKVTFMLGRCRPSLAGRDSDAGDCS